MSDIAQADECVSARTSFPHMPDTIDIEYSRHAVIFKDGENPRNELVVIDYLADEEFDKLKSMGYKVTQMQRVSEPQPVQEEEPQEEEPDKEKFYLTCRENLVKNSSASTGEMLDDFMEKGYARVVETDDGLRLEIDKAYAMLLSPHPGMPMSLVNL